MARENEKDIKRGRQDKPGGQQPTRPSQAPQKPQGGGKPGGMDRPRGGGGIGGGGGAAGGAQEQRFGGKSGQKERPSEELEDKELIGKEDVEEEGGGELDAEKGVLPGIDREAEKGTGDEDLSGER